MQYLNKSFSVNGPATTAGACEACVYGRGPHAEWCDTGQKLVEVLPIIEKYFSDVREIYDDADEAPIWGPKVAADLEVLRAQVGDPAQSAVSGTEDDGARMSGLFREWHEQTEETAGPFLGEILWPDPPDYVPAKGGCSCCGNSVRAGGCN